jgi:hypothetical protein
MKNNKLLYTFCVLAASLVLFQGCINDESVPSGDSGISFTRTSTNYFEADGEGMVEIPVEASSGVEFAYEGSATLDADYEVVGFTNGILTLNILDDDDLEQIEEIRIEILEANGGVGNNNFHTVKIVSNCADTENPYLAYFAGDWNATEFYCGLGVTTGACDYGPYLVHLVQDEEQPNKFLLDDFYDSGYDVYMVFDAANGTVHFPDQDAGGDPTDPEITASTGTYTLDDCSGNTTLVISINYDGADWVYRFAKL